MSPREQLLMRALSAERARAKRLLAQLTKARRYPNAPPRCIYCGTPTKTARACPSHRDLLAIEA